MSRNLWQILTAVLGVVTLALASVVIAQAFALRERGWRVEMGSLPDWFAGIGGIATIGALIVAWLVYRHDVTVRHADERHRAVEERRAQAALLSAWFMDYGSVRLRAVIAFGQPVGVAIPDAPRELVNVVDIALINASQVVIYDLTVAVVCKPHDPLPVMHSETDVRLSEPVEWNEERDRLARGVAPVLAPGEWSVGLRMAHASLVPEQLHLFFRDHQGVYWWRDADGQLREQPRPDVQDADGRDRQIAEVLGVETDGRVDIVSTQQLTGIRSV